MVGAAVAGSAVAAKALAQASAPDFAKQAHDNMQRNADTLSKFSIPLATEPAFQFKA